MPPLRSTKMAPLEAAEEWRKPCRARPMAPSLCIDDTALRSPLVLASPASAPSKESREEEEEEEDVEVGGAVNCPVVRNCPVEPKAGCTSTSARCTSPHCSWNPPRPSISPFSSRSELSLDCIALE